MNQIFTLLLKDPSLYFHPVLTDPWNYSKVQKKYNYKDVREYNIRSYAHVEVQDCRLYNNN